MKATLALRESSPERGQTNACGREKFNLTLDPHTVSLLPAHSCCLQHCEYGVEYGADRGIRQGNPADQCSTELRSLCRSLPSKGDVTRMLDFLRQQAEVFGSEF